MRAWQNERLLKRELEREARTLTKKDLEQHYVETMTEDETQRDKKATTTVWLAVAIMMLIIAIVAAKGLYNTARNAEENMEAIARTICEEHNQALQYTIETETGVNIRCTEEKIKITRTTE